MIESDDLSEPYSLEYIRGLADTHGSLNLIGGKSKNNRAITFRSLDESILDELALHLRILNYEYKRYIQAPAVGKKAQYMLRIHKQNEVRRFCREVRFRRIDRVERASEFLAERLA